MTKETHKFDLPIRDDTSDHFEHSSCQSKSEDEEESEHNNYKINKSFKDMKYNPSNASEYRPKYSITIDTPDDAD